MLGGSTFIYISRQDHCEKNSVAKSGEMPSVSCLSNHDENGGKNVIRKVCIFSDETLNLHALHERFSGWYICCPICPVNDVE